MKHYNELSKKRQERAKRNLTGTVKGAVDRKCINQKITTIGTWENGEPKQIIEYLHVTKGWRKRLLAPLHAPISHLLRQKQAIRML